MPEPTSLTHLWARYRKGLAELPVSRHEMKLMREAFFIGAIGICRILMHLERRGDAGRVSQVINRTARYREKVEKDRRRSRH